MKVKGSAVAMCVAALCAQAQLPGDGRPVSWSRVLPNIGQDQKQIWTSPFRAHPKRTWIGASAVVGLAAGLVAADVHEARYFRGTNQYSEFNEAFNTNATEIGILAAPAVLYLGGALSKDPSVVRPK